MYTTHDNDSSDQPNWSTKARASCGQTGLDLNSAYTTLLKAYLRTRTNHQTLIPKQASERR